MTLNQTPTPTPIAESNREFRPDSGIRVYDSTDKAVFMATPRTGFISLNGRTGDAIITVHEDGRVDLSANINLDAVRGLEMPYLLMIREIVNTAIYDRTKTGR